MSDAEIIRTGKIWWLLGAYAAFCLMPMFLDWAAAGFPFRLKFWKSRGE